MTADSQNPADMIARGAESLGVTLPSGAPEKFTAYAAYLDERGENVNLTAITGAKHIAQLHFLDSLALLTAYGFKDARVIDIGSGAGFPGLPVKIAEPSVSLTMLDATGKRVEFLTELTTMLGIEATCIHARAEEAAHDRNLRGSYDIALSRAVARLNALCELCLPYVRAGGAFLAMKSTNTEQEIAEARGAIEKLGAELRGCIDYAIPGTDITHRAVIIAKTAETPDKYPRRFARIQKSPL